MTNPARRLAFCLTLFAPALALAQRPSDYDANTVVVVTPPPIVVTGASPQAPGAAEMPPAAAAAATPAPQTDAWSDVSHINGQVVPVGERGNYLHKWKKTNISSNPIGWLAGFYGVSVAQAISNNVTVRGDVNMFSGIEGNHSGYEVGLSLPIYFKRVFQGPFIEGGVMVRDFNSEDEGGASYGPEVLFGWHWTFDSGLNVSFAVGAMKNMNREMTEYDEYNDSSDTVEPTGYFRVGYAF